MGLNDSGFKSTLVSEHEEFIKFENVNVYDAVRAGDHDEFEESYFVDFGNEYLDYVRVSRADWKLAPDPYELPKGHGAVVRGALGGIYVHRGDDVWFSPGGGGTTTSQELLGWGGLTTLAEGVSI